MRTRRRSSFAYRTAVVMLACCSSGALSPSAVVHTSDRRFHSRLHKRSGPGRSSRATLQAGLGNEDDYSRLIRRIARLERIVSDQHTEVEQMRSSMEHMRMIVQIQAQIDSCLVSGGGEDEHGLIPPSLLSSSNLEGDAAGGGGPDPRLVEQVIRLLRARQRVLRAWEIDGEPEGASSRSYDDGKPSAASDLRPGRSSVEDNSSSGRIDGGNSGRSSNGGGGSGGNGDGSVGGGDDAARRRRRRGQGPRRWTRDSRSLDLDNYYRDYDDGGGDDFLQRSPYDEFPPPMAAAAKAGNRGAGGGGSSGGGISGSSSDDGRIHGSSISNSGSGGSGSGSGSRKTVELFEPRPEPQRPPRTNQDAADAAGAGVVAALMEGRRRLIVEVDDAQLRYNSPDFCHQAMAEFVELLVLPLTTALENLKARQNRCKIVIQGAHHAKEIQEAMVLDAPESLQVVSLEDGHVAKTDRVVTIISPENWKGKRGRHLRRMLDEARDAAIILVNPTDADKFLKPAAYNTFERVYHLSPMWIDYLQPLPPQQRPSLEYDDRERFGADGGGAGGGWQKGTTGEALLLERLGESVWAEEEAMQAAAAAAALDSAESAVKGAEGAPAQCEAATAAAAAAEAEAEAFAAAASAGDVTAGASPQSLSSLLDGASSGVGAAAAAEIGVRAAERALARAALEFGTAAATRPARADEGEGGVDDSYRDSGDWGTEREHESTPMSDESAAAAALAAWSVEYEEGGEGGGNGGGLVGKEAEELLLRWGEGGGGEWDGRGDEATEMSALAVTLRQYPDAWEAFVDLQDGMGFRLCGTWDLEPPQAAVKTVVMDHILRIVMD